MLIAAISALAFLSACSSIKNQASSSKATPLDLEGLWIAQGFPCGGGHDVQLSLRQQKKLLAASCAAESECAPIGAQMWQGELPVEVVRSDDLPLTLRVELAVPVPRTAAVTVISAEHMVLLFDETTVKLRRGTPEAPPKVDETAGQGGRDSRPEDEPQPAGSGAMSAAPDAAAAGGAAGKAAAAGGGSGAAGMANWGGAGAASPAAGSGGSAPLAGSGGASTAAGSSGAAGQGGSSSSAGSLAPGPVPEPDLGDLKWFCLNSFGTCACVPTNSATQSAADCAVTYPCCYTEIRDNEPDCVCNAKVGGSCVDLADDPDYRPVDWCPGQSR